MKDGRIRVLHVLQTMGVGGMEKRILRLCSGLDNALYDIHAVSLRVTEGVMIDWPKDRHHFYPIASGLHPQRLLGLAKLMREGQYDIVHSHNWATMLYGVLAGRLAQVPIVLHGEHGPNQDDWKGVSRKRETAMALLAHLATRVVAVNDFIEQEVQTRWKLPRARVVCIPNGVDLVRFSPNLQVDRANNEFVIGTVARFDRIKNLPCIIRGFDLFKKSNPLLKPRLVLVGDGPIRNELQSLVDSLDCADAITFPGETKSPESWYSKFDIYVNSSFSEGMSNTILEGMACGLPVVASDVSGNKCWLESGVNALFFESDNPHDLCRSFSVLAQDAALFSKMGSENRQRVERQYDNRDFLLSYHNLYQQLLKK